MPFDQEFKTMEDFVVVMKPLVDVTEVIGAHKWVTISTLRPILYKLLNNHLPPVSGDSELVKSMKKVLSGDLGERYTGDTLQLLTKACFLDPRFKGLKFLSEEHRQDVIFSLKLDIDMICPVDSTTTSLPPTKKSKGENKLMEFLEDITDGSGKDT